MKEEVLNTDFRNGILKKLRERICTVHFTKADGEKRIMECTLNPEFIPEEFAPKSSAQPNTEIVKAFDVRAMDGDPLGLIVWTNLYLVHPRYNSKIIATINPFLGLVFVYILLYNNIVI